MNSVRSVTVVVILLVVASGDARAYVDPGSGMLIWQGLIALIGAIVVFVRHPVDALRKLFKRLSGK